MRIAAAPERLLPRARAEIENPNTMVYASAASAWEMEIKTALGKLEAPADLAGARNLCGAAV